MKWILKTKTLGYCIFLLYIATIEEAMKKPLKIVFIGSYIPRKCGIATFTYDLFKAVAGETRSDSLRVIAMNNILEGYNYPAEVSFEIQQNHLPDYQSAADYINFSDVDLVCLQHEFGLFGGAAGRYISSLIGGIRKPIVTTLHTIIKEPEPEYRISTNELIRYSDRLVVMSKMGREILKQTYGVPDNKIKLIYHGVPDFTFVDPDKFKKRLYLEGRFMILTFGLLSSGKGIEFVLDALPPVVEKNPNLIYLILGATHPEVKKNEGEKYRLFLERKVHSLGLDNNVIFHNRFVTVSELCKYISASDIYISPYLSREQIVSGALSYAIGMGKAIISTPFWYAEEMLAKNRGLLVDFKDVDGFSQALFSLINDPVKYQKLRKNAYKFGRKMIWKEVGRQYFDLFEVVIDERIHKAEKQWETLTFSRTTLPDIKLDHLKLLTDDVGLFQHAAFGIPDRNHGYSTDDMGRALVTLIRMLEQKPNKDLLPLITLFLSFLEHAQTEDGHFHNYLGYDRRFLDEKGSEDTLGRAIYGLGYVVGSAPTGGMRAMAFKMMERSEHLMEYLEDHEHPRSTAYTVCGLYAALKKYEGASRFRRILIKLSDELMAMHEENRRDNWNWFGPVVTYGNAKICEALLHAFQVTKDEKYKKVALSTLDFLTNIQWNGNFFDLVGNEGWYHVNGEKAIFGQQPIDAGYLTKAYITAYVVTGDKKYLHLAHRAFEWFLGRNRLGMPVYDFSTGAVADGLDSQGVSANQGAESVICFLLALLALSRYTSHVIDTDLTQYD
jgi:glycosyltransferase involved in cell wall biosynthesis